MPIEMIRTEIRPSPSVPFYEPTILEINLINFYTSSGKIIFITNYIEYDQGIEIKIYKMIATDDTALAYILADPRWQLCVANMNEYATNNNIKFTETHPIV